MIGLGSYVYPNDNETPFYKKYAWYWYIWHSKSSITYTYRRIRRTAEIIKL